jgi:hypothetical protein
VQLPFEFGPDVLVDLYTTEGELGRPPANPILATATVNGTSATLDEPAEPPEDHFAIDTDPGGLSFTTAAVFAYTDADGSGSYGAGEPIVATSDGGAYPVEAMYVLPTDLRGALYLATGLSAGWNLVADRGSDTPLFPDWAEGITLESY